MAWLAGYLNRRAITIDQTKVDATLANFPVMVKLQNLLTNGNFESGTTGWTASTATLAAVHNMRKFGSHSLAVTATGASGYAYQHCGGTIYPEFIGKVVTFSAWAWCATPNTAILSLKLTATNYYSAYHPGDSQWHLLTVSVTMPADPAYILAIMRAYGAGNMAYYDGAYCSEGTPPDPYQFFAKSLSTGYDTRFTSSNGTTLLSFERARWDSANGIAEFYVKVPSVSSSTDTVIYMYYNNPAAADAAVAANAWDAYFEAVWHMDDATTSTVADSTSHALTATKVAANEPIQANHRLGLAQDFDGVNDQINTAGTALATSFTISGWINIQGGVSYAVFIGSASTNRILISVATGFAYAQMGAGNQVGAITPGVAFWHHYAYVFDNATSTAQIFVDGVPDTTLVGHVDLAAFKIGRYTTSYMTLGSIDEVRLSSTARTAAWIKADFHSGDCSLLAIGAVEYPDQHIILEASYFASSQEINRVFVVGRDRTGITVSGTTHLDAEVSLVGERLEVQHNPAALTAAMALDVATAILARNRLDQRRAELLVPPHCGLELWDVLAVYDPVANQETLYRVIGYRLEYAKGAYFHRLQLCAV